MLSELRRPGNSFPKKFILITLGFLIGLVIACNPLTSVSQSIDGGGTEKLRLTAVHRSGQTFLTWTERADLQGEIYRIYRSERPIKSSNLKKAKLVAEVGENSSVFYVNRAVDTKGMWYLRYAERLIIEDGGEPLPEGTGLFVWTVSAEDFKGKQEGSGYYAVTISLPGEEEAYSRSLATGRIKERVEDPKPVEITSSPGVNPGEGGHVFIQTMDFRNWNATFHAPNQGNNYYGLDPNAPGIQNSLQYAYDYTIYEPTAELCGGVVPEVLPVYFFLHGWRGNRYSAYEQNPYPYCAYGIIPFDISQTWYFGFAKHYDYRQGSTVPAGDVIENFTEQRVLRMLYDLERFPPGPTVDAQRVYVFGHSMGGSGALAFAERYPNVFAAAYSGQPITNYLTAGITEQDWAADVALKWGAPDLNLPISLSGPGGWADHLQKNNGAGVWDWQNYGLSAQGQKGVLGLGDEMAPLGIDHGIPDEVILWSTQGQPIYPSLDAGLRAWGGAVTDADHEWSNFLGMPPTMGIEEAPFWNFQVMRDESVPGLSNLSGNSKMPPTSVGTYNQTILWSASWNAWDGAPQDQPDLWSISLCAVTVGSHECGSGERQTVDITPRRVQNFVFVPGMRYDWKNVEVASGKIIAQGTVSANSRGLVTIKKFVVSPDGEPTGFEQTQVRWRGASIVVCG